MVGLVVVLEAARQDRVTAPNLGLEVRDRGYGKGRVGVALSLLDVNKYKMAVLC